MAEEVVMDQRFKQAIMVILSTCIDEEMMTMTHIQSAALELLLFVAGDYLKRLTDSLHRLVEVHRHSASPGISEVSMMLFLNKVQLGDLDIEMERTSNHAVDHQVIHYLQQPLPSPQEKPQQPEHVPAIAPSQRLRSYMPPWLPSLPADHTYIHTPDYPERTTQPKDIREELVKESLNAANALKSLSESIDSARQSHNDNKENDNHTGVTSPPTQEQPSPSSRHNLVDVTSLDSDQRFDIVALAKRKHQQNTKNTTTTNSHNHSSISNSSSKNINRHRIKGKSGRILLERHYKMALLGLELQHHHHQ